MGTHPFSPFSLSSSFGALVGQALTVRLINLDAAGTALAPAIEVDFGGVSLVASPVPEPGPAAMWLSGLALAALLVARRKKGTHPFSLPHDSGEAHTPDGERPRAAPGAGSRCLSVSQPR